MIASPRYLLLTYRYMEARNLCRIEEKTTILDDEGRELDFFWMKKPAHDESFVKIDADALTFLLIRWPMDQHIIDENKDIANEPIVVFQDHAITFRGFKLSIRVKSSPLKVCRSSNTPNDGAVFAELAKKAQAKLTCQSRIVGTPHGKAAIKIPHLGYWVNTPELGTIITGFQ